MKSLLNYIRKIDEDSSRQKIAKPLQNKNREIVFTKTKKYRKYRYFDKEEHRCPILYSSSQTSLTKRVPLIYLTFCE